MFRIMNLRARVNFMHSFTENRPPKKYRKRLMNTSFQKKYSTASDYSIIDFVNDLCSSSSISSLHKIQHSFYPQK